MKKFLWALLAAFAVVGGLYVVAVTKWSYSVGERAGWIQKFSSKGWVCKTWEGEMAMVTMPGTMPEKFTFTVHDAAVVSQIEASMGHRVSLSYEQKKFLPTSCFGDTEYWIVGVRVLPESLGVPGMGVPETPAPPAGSATAPASAPAPVPAAPK